MERPPWGCEPVGSGQFLLANFSPALEASDLAKYGSFVALVQTLAQQLGPGTAAKEASLDRWRTVSVPAVVSHWFRVPAG